MISEATKQELLRFAATHLPTPVWARDEKTWLKVMESEDLPPMPGIPHILTGKRRHFAVRKLYNETF